LTASRNESGKSTGDPKAPFTITSAVVFGDFLLQRSRVQAADVGIGLAVRHGRSELRNAAMARDERKFLRQLRGRSALVQIWAYADWMKHRSHIDVMR
jgi:hypothetical protein